ncbi:hypothetical protein [Vallitalea guaymasensis]|uniref:Uncharacterized protein n=1 Tax=Vallitalea guaymasensis TaxID=1185412 RepID=A0A8J8MDA9_9FIRM|nr:hypothetical protein [Vallitalea guaymasensis]QUH30718.1 hypothetical protein HYG85_18055 [Vallitalea guaymasensis]
MTYENGSARYTMEVNETEKFVHLSASGFYKEEDGDSFINAYNKLVGSMNTNNYVLVINLSNDLKPSSPPVADKLTDLMKRYIEVPFKRRFLLTEGNIITISQFKRLGKQIPGWDEGIEYADNMQEVKSKLA